MNKLTVGGIILGTIAGLSFTPAVASHTHVHSVGNEGKCVLVAAKGGEENVSLPDTVAGEFPPDRKHPLHVNVHFGQPGSDGDWAVAGTAAADNLCPGGIIN